MGVVEAIYERVGTPLSEDARAAMHAMHGESKPAHRYELADFGLTGEEVDERFGFR
jgi:hypothetical protein